jgi:hypothetical protein
MGVLAKYFLFISLLGSSCCALGEEFPGFILNQHQTTLKTYLSQHPNYLLAPESFCDCQENLVQLRQQMPEFQPYYAVGDINDDRIEDFAVALVEKQNITAKNPDVSVVVFHGPFKNEKPNKGIVAVKRFSILRPKEVLSVFKARVEAGHRIPARLDFGPGVFGSDDVQVIFYNKKTKKYQVQDFYGE